MSLFKIEGKLYEEPEFSSISDWKPPDRYPNFYKICFECSRPFYTRFDFISCPICRNVPERALISTRQRRS